jgi:hypothetical protein
VLEGAGEVTGSDGGCRESVGECREGDVGLRQSEGRGQGDDHNALPMNSSPTLYQ